MNSFRIRQDGSTIELIVDGRLVASLPWQSALEVSKAIQSKAKLAEEFDKHELIIADGAILHAAGLNFGISDNKLIQKEILKEAQKINSSIASREVFGAPSIKHK